MTYQKFKDILADKHNCTIQNYCVLTNTNYNKLMNSKKDGNKDFSKKYAYFVNLASTYKISKTLKELYELIKHSGEIQTDITHANITHSNITKIIDHIKL